MSTSLCAEQLGNLPIGVSPTPPQERRVGIGYTLWHVRSDWAGSSTKAPWGSPELGYYVSSDRSVMQKHAAWLTDAGVDFILLDWSNDLDADTRDQHGAPDQLFIENTTPLLFDTFTALKQRPRIAFLLGLPGNILREAVRVRGEDLDIDQMFGGKLKIKTDQIYEQYVQHRTYGPLLETYLGKPLLVIFLGTPCAFQHQAPKWADSRFTVRYMTAYIAEQPELLGPDRISKYGFWSWEERGPPSYTSYQGHPEAMTIVAAWRPGPQISAQGRKNGGTYRANWERARQIGPRYALAGTFNEWWKAEQPSAELSKDIEPSKEFGHLYLKVLSEEAKLFKAGK